MHLQLLVVVLKTLLHSCVCLGGRGIERVGDGHNRADKKTSVTKGTNGKGGREKGDAYLVAVHSKNELFLDCSASTLRHLAWLDW